jgi:hypothetical protein
MARNVLPSAITANDIIHAIGGEIQPTQKTEKENFPAVQDNSTSVPLKISEIRKNKLSKRTITSAAIILLTIPATIFFGIYFLDDRSFYFISMLIILQTMLPFALIYEGRKPRVREIVVIAVMCALAIAGRVAFFMLPQFKPVIAI